HIKNTSYQREALVARYYQDFAWFRLPSHLMMALSLQAPVFLVSMLYDSAITGQLGLAMMALSLPLSLIGNSMSRAYYAEIAAVGKNNALKIKRITFDIQKKLFLIGLPTAIAVLL